MLNTYSYLPLAAAILFLFQGIFVYIKSKSHRSIRLGFLLNSCVTFWWQFCWFLLFNASNIYWAKVIAHIGYMLLGVIAGPDLVFLGDFDRPVGFHALDLAVFCRT